MVFSEFFSANRRTKTRDTICICTNPVVGGPGPTLSRREREGSRHARGQQLSSRQGQQTCNITATLLLCYACDIHKGMLRVYVFVYTYAYVLMWYHKSPKSAPSRARCLRRRRRRRRLCMVGSRPRQRSTTSEARARCVGTVSNPSVVC